MKKGKRVEIKNIKDIQRAKKEDVSQADSTIIDAWVDSQPTQNNTPAHQESGEPSVNESRFTIVIPTYLHRRIKKHCAINGSSMKDTLTEILEKAFPET